MKHIKQLTPRLALHKSFPYILIVMGAIGFLASATINVKKAHLLANPTADLGCNLNPVYSCGSVLSTPQAEIFGFSNELLGIGMFAAIVTLGVLLLAGGVFKAWLWRIYLLGMAGSMAFVFWFFYQSVYNINALCIFCSFVWFATWTVTVAGAAWTYDRGYWPTLPPALRRIAAWLRQRVLYVWLALIVLFAGLILHHFWYYYGQYFGY